MLRVTTVLHRTYSIKRGNPMPVHPDHVEHVEADGAELDWIMDNVPALFRQPVPVNMWLGHNARKIVKYWQHFIG